MNEHWTKTHWTDGLEQAVIDAIEAECVRQHVDESRRGYLRRAFERAQELASRDEIPTVDTFLELAGLLEPVSGGELRTTPVTFTSGGPAAPAGVLPTAVPQLFNFWPGTNGEELLKKHWLKEFLVLHPLRDGNGRTAWIFQQWLMESWEEPEPLWGFDF